MTDLTLHDTKSKQAWNLTLDGGFRSGCQITSMTGDGSNNIVLTAQEKVLGRFDEQSNWKGGRGVENYRDNPDGYFDASAWTLTPNHILPALRWNITTGHRNINKALPGSLTWKALTGTTLYREVSFTGTAYDADKCWIWLRKVGNPGTLTLELCSNNAGDPGTVQKTITLVASAVTDVLSIFHDFDWATTYTLSATTFHIKLYGASTDTDANHWEIGGNSSGSGGKYSSDGSTWTSDTWSMYYYITDADIDRRWFFWRTPSSFGGYTFFMVSKRASGNSEFYGWDETNDVWTVVGTTGLGVVTGRPLVETGQVLFPQGTTTIRKWNGTNFDDDATDDATMLTIGYDAADGPQVWKAHTNSVARANVQAWSTDLTFRTAITIGDSSYNINAIKWFQGQLWVLKGDSVWTVANDRATMVEYGISDAPSTVNGQAVGVWQQFLFWNWLFSDERLYGGTLDDVGLGWRGPALPYGREGITTAYATYMGWLFVAKDAGSTGTSSVFAYDGLGWHEVFRAWDTGLRIQDIMIQPESGTQRSRLWIQLGDHVVYIELPLSKANPLYDTGVVYQHESYLITSTIDAGASARLPKYIRDLTGLIQNLATGIQVKVDYQADKNIGTNTWYECGMFDSSPESVVDVNVSDIRKIRFRLRLETATTGTPPDIQGLAPNGYARAPYRLVYTLRIKSGDSMNPDGTKGVDSDKLLRWLLDTARTAGRVRMTSKKHALLDNVNVILPPPAIFPQGNNKDISTIVLIEA